MYVLARVCVAFVGMCVRTKGLCGTIYILREPTVGDN